MKYKGKIITIDDFIPVILWGNIEIVMGKRNFKEFEGWMFGQTAPFGGVYLHDMERFLAGKDPLRY